MNPEDLVLMLNAGWSLEQIALYAGTGIKDVEQIIVGQMKLERLMERELSFA
jgi:hypothetical protein